MDRASYASCQAALIVLVAAACVPPPARVPMASIARPAPVAARTLVVFLPGRGSTAATFVKYGFDDPGADLIFADATEGYYFDGSVIARLEEDVIAPARVRGHERVWLVGVSLGGLGAVLYAKAHPGEVDGVILLAPYLGDDRLRREIESAGGLLAWSGSDGANGFDRSAREAWSWLRDTARAGRTPVWLGYGQDDRFRRSHALLAAALPRERVLTAEGGHDWSVWKRLWSALAARGAAD